LRRGRGKFKRRERGRNDYRGTIKATQGAEELSQGDIERKTGLLRCYISRVENGHTVPSVETLEKFAHALEVPMYQLFYDSEKPPKLPTLSKRGSADDSMWGSSGGDARILAKFRRLFGRLKEHDLKLVLVMAQQMQRRKIPTK
jgi:transcriptional regulator with XRE-family HTH domain